MPSPSQRSFASGELAPVLRARVGTAEYATGLDTLRNAYVLRTGGVTSRPGTVWKGSTKGNGAARLIDCVFADDQNYLLEFGNEYVRFWKDGALVEGTVYGAWADATVYVAGLVVSYSGTNYVCLQNHTSATANDRPTTGTDWEDYWYALSGLVYELPTPYLTADLDAVQVGQVPTTLYLVHPSYAPRQLVRSTNAVWTFSEVVFDAAGTPPTNVTASVSGTGGFTYGVTAVFADGTESILSSTDETSNTAFSFTNCTVTWTAVTGAVSYYVYRAATALYVPFYRIGSSETTTFVDAAPFGVEFVGPPDAADRFASADNYPSVIGFYQQRMLLAASNNAPDRVDASVSATPTDFTTRDPLVDSDALAWRQISRRATRVKHFLSIAERLIGFTDVGEFIIQGDTDGVLRPGEVNPRQLSYNGAASIPPVAIDDTALYVQARGTRVRSLVPFNQDGYSGTELSRTASHLVDGYTIVAWAYQENPENVLWIVRSDGVLLSLTFVRESNIIGWARHDTDGLVESVAVVQEGAEDAVYLVVRRTIDGSTVRFVERMADRLADEPVCVDAAMTVDHRVTDEVDTDGDTQGTLTVSGPDYGAGEPLTLTASQARFVPNGLGTWAADTITGASLLSWFAPVGVNDRIISGRLSFSAPATTGVDDLAFSADGGATWTVADSGGADDQQWQGVVWMPFASLYAVCGISAGGTLAGIATSPTGATWTLRATAVTQGYSGLVTSATRAVAFAADGSANTLRTTNGTAWTDTTTSGGPAGGWAGVGCYATTPALFLGVGYDGSGDTAIYSSPDGETWTLRYTFTGTTPDVAMTWDATLGLVVLVTSDGRYGTSSTGTSFTVASFTGGASGFSGTGLATAGGFLLAVGDNRDILTSSNGTTWTRTASATSQDTYAVSWSAAAARFFAGGSALGSTDDAYETVLYGNPAQTSVGRTYRLFHPTTGEATDYLVSAVTSGTACSVTSTDVTPTAMQSVAIAHWVLLTDTFAGFDHLEGETVSVQGDGRAVAAPYNPEYAAVTVTNGEISLSGEYGFVTVGLPFVTDIQTLDIDAVSPSLKQVGTQVGGLGVWLEESGPFFTGPKAVSGNAVTGLEAFVPKDSEGYPLAAGTLFTGYADWPFYASWNQNGRVFLRNVDPSPLTVLAILPMGLIGGR